MNHRLHFLAKEGYEIVVIQKEYLQLNRWENWRHAKGLSPQSLYNKSIEQKIKAEAAWRGNYKDVST